MPTEERVQGRCGQQRRGEDQGRGGVRCLGSLRCGTGCSPSPRAKSEVSVVSTGPVVWFWFSLFCSDYQSCACSCRKSKSPNPSPEVTSPLTCIVKPSSLFSLQVECTFYFCKSRTCSTAVFHPTLCSQDPSVPLPGDLLAAP